MKKLIPLIACLVLSVMAFAQGGVDFQHLTFDEALAKAKAEKKLVFVDCYTTWCGPCKNMTNNVFPQKAAGDFFNPRFVCVKFDMEKGEGIDLKKKLGVKAYPSFFIIRPDGTVQHSVVGGGELEGFIERIERGLNEKTSLLYLENQYKKGKMNKKQLMAYKVALTDAYNQKKADEIQKELSAKLTDKDKVKADFWPLFEEAQVGSADFDFVLANLPKLEKNIGKEKLEKYLDEAYYGALQSAFYNRGGEKVDLNKLKEQISNLKIARQPMLMMDYNMLEIASAGDVKKLLNLLNSEVANLKDGELWLAISALQKVQPKATKEELSQMVALGEKLIAAQTDDNAKGYLTMIIDNYKRLAHVGVYFEDLTFEKALEKAKNMHKKLFIDCYTSWCGPCKYMTSSVFPQEKIGDFMNPKFISVKYDMEKGEGPELAKKFGVRAYPTFVILNSDGTVYHKMVGGGEADQFIKRLEEGLDPKKASGALDKKYNEGNRDKAFLADYVKSLSSLYSTDAKKVADELYGLLTDDEKASQDYWFLFDNDDLVPEGSEGMKYLLANREKFNQSIGKEKVDKRLSKGYEKKIMMILYGRDTKTTAKELDQMKKDITALKLANQKTLLGSINIAKAVLAKNPNQLLTVCEKEINQMPAEEFPYYVLVYNAKGTATPLQMSRWIKLGKKVVANAQDPRYKEGMENLVKSLEEKK